MPDSGPTMFDILRRLDDQAKATERVVERVELLAGKLEERYMPRGEYNEARKADAQRISELEKDGESQASFRRQVVAGFLVGAALIISNIVVALTGLRGGS